MSNPHQIVRLVHPRELAPTERAILEHLLSKEFPGVAALRLQLPLVRVEEECKDCLTIGLFIHHEEALRAVVEHQIPIEAEGNDLDGIRIHILLHVVDGYMDELEIFREDPNPIQELPPPRTLELINYWG